MLTPGQRGGAGGAVSKARGAAGTGGPHVAVARELLDLIEFSIAALRKQARLTAQIQCPTRVHTMFSPALEDAGHSQHSSGAHVRLPLAHSVTMHSKWRSQRCLLVSKSSSGRKFSKSRRFVTARVSSCRGSSALSDLLRRPCQSTAAAAAWSAAPATCPSAATAAPCASAAAPQRPRRPVPAPSPSRCAGA